MADRSLVTIMSNLLPPRDSDGDDDDDEDEDGGTEPNEEREPTVIREPDEGE